MYSESETETSTSESSDEDFGIECKIDYSYKLLKNRYWIIKKLGIGGCSSVWMAYDFETLKWFALKIHYKNSKDESINETKFLRQFTVSESPNFWLHTETQTSSVFHRRCLGNTK